MRTLFVLLICATLSICMPVYASSAQDWLTYTNPVGEERPVQAGTQLAVGSTAVMSGYFATDLWGTNTADLDVRTLLHGYQTVAWADGRPWFNRTAVKNANAQKSMDGAWVFTLEIAEDLVYNDGTPLTAADYVFSLLLEASPAVEALGGAPRDLSYIPGYEAYHAGEQNAFRGVYLVSPTAFAVEIRKEALSDFYGPQLLLITPYPAAVIAPGFEVLDEGAGAFLSKDGEHSGLTTELLSHTLLDPEAGYVWNPRVTSGPYMLADYEPGEKQVAFTVNPNFAGDPWGNRPAIERLTFAWVDADGAAEKLAADEIGLMNKMFDPDFMAQLQALQNVVDLPYPRTGLAYLAFAAERGLGNDPVIRKAIAMALDRDALVRGQPGLERVYGYYGPGQWMVSAASTAELRSLDIPLDRVEANRLLDTTPWRLDERGGARSPGASGLRYRERNGKLKALTLTWARAQESGLADGVEAMLREGLAQLGIGLQVVRLPFTDLLAQYYHQQEREADLYFLASEFPAAFDPLGEFSPDAEVEAYRNATSLRDAALTEQAQAMLFAGFENRAGYLQAWLLFQRRFSDVLPMVPLYSGMYHDFHTPDLVGYDVASSGSWAQAIVAARFR
jgi:peptide/nickel transport system substrate-binding protein